MEINQTSYNRGRREAIEHLKRRKKNTFLDPLTNEQLTKWAKIFYEIAAPFENCSDPAYKDDFSENIGKADLYAEKAGFDGRSYYADLKKVKRI
jgi:hypothetical protein